MRPVDRLNQSINVLKEEILSGTKYENNEKDIGKLSLSASDMSNEPLQVYLRIKYGIQKKDEINASVFGTLIHSGLEHLKKKDFIKTEYSVKKEYRGWILSATLDRVDTKNKVIMDYKITKRYTLEKFTQDNGYAKQLRFQNWLLDDDYQMLVAMFIKDYEGNFKKKEIDLLQFVDVEQRDIVTEIDLYIDKINSWLDGSSEPEQCSDLWWRGSRGKSEPMRCVKYCSYNSVCPFYKEIYKKIDDLDW